MSDKSSKEFDEWNVKKKRINARADLEQVFFKEQEIWWCHLGVNIGFEQDGKGNKFLRPVLVLRKFSMHTFAGLPLTTTDAMHPLILRCDSVDGEFRRAILSQIKVLDARRLYLKISSVSKESFQILRKAVRQLF